VIFPSNIYQSSLHLAQQSHRREFHVIQKRINNLLKMEEDRARAKMKFEAHRQTIKCFFDKNYASEKEFQVGDLVIK
jgi:hypothetical protein